ncbi:MAG TPA: YceI family protein [Candidatus Elarobacter sp.]|nr:YceI family protein [Candidatus Elarobacter sp.]
MQAEATPALPAAGTYSLDPPHTFIYFAARHLVVGMVRGRFDRIGGTLVVATDPADRTLDETIDAVSLSTQNTTRDDDLRSGAFFDVANFPTATYRGRGIHRAGGGWLIDGVLAIRGVSQVVALTFTYNGTAAAVAGQPRRIAFQGTAALKRADFNMTRDLLSEIGVRSAAADVTLEINAEALAAGQSRT